MRLYEVLTGNMTYDQAVQIFTRLGVDPTGMDPATLSKARKQIIMQHHPDRGGAPGVAQMINAAYDVLVKGSQAQPSNSYTSRSYKSQGGTWDDVRSQDNQYDEERYPIWAQAGYSGGLRDTGRIYRNDYTDVNFIKKSMWELSGKSNKEYTIWGFDGHYFRGVVSVFGSPQIFDYMAQAMFDWQTKGGNPYQCRAVFVSVRKSKQLLLIYADGQFYGSNPIAVEHESFNMNPGNDEQFVRRLPDWLDQLAAQHQQA